MSKSLAVSPLSYDDKLTLKEARARLKEAKKVFNEVQKLNKKNTTDELPSEHNKALVECTGMLLPLGTQQSVQNEILEIDDMSKSVHTQSAQLLQDIMLYVANFTNTGVTVVPGVGLF